MAAAYTPSSLGGRLWALLFLNKVGAVVLSLVFFLALMAIVVFAVLVVPFFKLAGRMAAHRVMMVMMAEWIWNQQLHYVEHKCGISYRYTGVRLPPRENAIVICNHIYWLDWLNCFSLASRTHRLGACKFFAKDIIKYIPGLGWGLYLLDSVFLSRNWGDDREAIMETFKKLRDHKMPVWMIFYPEGTRRTKEKLEASQRFAESRGLRRLNHVLMPRTKGFAATVMGLRDGAVDALYDFTLGYQDNSPPDLIESMCGQTSKDVFIHVRRWAITDLPTSKEGLADFIIKVFQEKDDLMAHFTEHGCFPGPEYHEPYHESHMNLSWDGTYHGKHEGKHEGKHYGKHHGNNSKKKDE
eukprot:TRINITY_DN1491_c0_g2_i1.p1 TRINITY_DN1491_c0_g2~~TRINITY_DN1491_c0_g2_i1.p1  ORF type:complete len:354 (-),score=57.57 TRINITY_DN1491_c0_g2_i1:57-1118(-)